MDERQEKILTEYISFRKIQNRSYRNHQSAIKIYFEYLERNDLDCFRVKIHDAQEFQHHLTTLTREDGSPHYKTSSILTIIGRLTSFYDYLKKGGQIYSNPFSDIHKIRKKKELPRNILNEEKMHKFLNHFRNFMAGENLIERRQRYKAHVIAELMYASGARVNEIAKLTLNDIDFTTGTVKLKDSKTGKERNGILNSFAEKVLRIYVSEMREYILFNRMSDLNLLFGAEGSMNIWLNNVLQREANRLKLGKISSHQFRHALGFHLLRAGCDIRYIQEILGHEELSTTQVYTKVDKEDLKRILDRFHPRVFKKEHDTDIQSEVKTGDA